MMKLVLTLCALTGVAAQDPASGWMAYAVGELPSGYERITTLEMTWKVGASPKTSLAFFSPWFGMDPDDNLNLIQPVNPWSRTSWSAYTEYYQWSPTHNSNSETIGASAGDTLHGSLVYDSASDSYVLTQTNIDTGASSTQTVACQSGKKYTVPYVVYEKTFPCADYPPDENVTFFDIVIECDGVDCADDVLWEANVKDANCDMAANILDSRTISITWDTSASSKYDALTDTELFDLNHHGWATKLGLERPVDADIRSCIGDVKNATSDVVSVAATIATATEDCKLDDMTACLADIDIIVEALEGLATHTNAAVRDCGDGEDSACGDDIVLVIDDAGDLTSAVSKAAVFCQEGTIAGKAKCAAQVAAVTAAVAKIGTHIATAVADCQ